MSRDVRTDATNVSVTIRFIDDTDGTPETGVTNATAGLDLWYRVGTAGAQVSITEIALTTPALTDAHDDGGILHIANGYCRLDLPDAAVPTSAGEATVVGGTATGMIVLGCELVGVTDLTAAEVNTQADTAITDAALATAANLATVDTVVDAILADTGTDGVVVASLAAGSITAAAIATDAVDADAIATDAVDEIANGVWTDSTRTLTQSAASVAAAVAGSTVTVEPYSTWTIALTGMGAFTGYTNLWVGVKADPANEPDTAALLLIDSDTGALYIDGAAAGATTDASIAVDDDSNGDITITVKGTVTGLAPGAYRYAIKWTDGTQWFVLSEGQWRVSSTVVRDTGTGA